MSRYNSTDRKGVTAVQSIIQNELDWIFREQPISDVGIDAMIEVHENGTPLAMFMGAQIKSGKGNFTKTSNSYRYYSSNIHYNYWTTSNIPIIMIAYIFELKKAFWIYLSSDNFIKTKKKWKIDIPFSQVLCSKSEKRLLSLIENHKSTSVQGSGLKPSFDDLMLKVNSFSSGVRFLLNSANEIQQFRNYVNGYFVQIEPFISNSLLYNKSKVNSLNKELSKKLNELAYQLESNINNFSFHFSEGLVVAEHLGIILKSNNNLELLDKLKKTISKYTSDSENLLIQVESVANVAKTFKTKDKFLKSSFNNLALTYDLIYSEITIAKNQNEKILSHLNNL